MIIAVIDLVFYMHVYFYTFLCIYVSADTVQPSFECFKF